MTMKTPERLAEDYAKNLHSSLVQIAEVYSGIKRIFNYENMKQAFLAGYKAAAPQWISVKKRLPTQNGPILMWSGRLEDVLTCAAAGYELWNWSTEYSPHDYRLFELTHWMPLPEPPKEESK